MTPTYTPTRCLLLGPSGKANVLGVYPASSIVSQQVSKNKRSWGSISSTSSGDILKNWGSKQSGSSIKPPHLDIFFPDGDFNPSRHFQSQRDLGISTIESLPVFKFCQNSWRFFA